MTLTIGTGPFGPESAGVFNFEREGPAHVLYLESSPRRVRVQLSGKTIADSKRVKLLHETGLLPVYYFPYGDVRTDLLERTDHETHCPFKGDAIYWNVRVGGRVAENAAWAYPEPLEGAPPLADHVAFYWSRMDRWFEEDEEVFVHPRDPYHRIDVLRSTRRVRISIEGELIAQSGRPTILFETGFRPRYYLPREDVREVLLVGSNTRTRCPYKGQAQYYSVEGRSSIYRDLVWYYPTPLPEAAKVANMLCFYDERVDVEVD